jgi:hypothetical protein
MQTLMRFFIDFQDGQRWRANRHQIPGFQSRLRTESEAEGLVGAHLSARAVERRVLLVISVIGLIGLVILSVVLLQGTSSIVPGV